MSRLRLAGEKGNSIELKGNTLDEIKVNSEGNFLITFI